MTVAKVQWTSSFNGGNSQSFTVIAVDAQERTLLSKRISDNGETKPHSTNMQNLQPSMTYVFYVSARNSRGESFSEFRICTTSDSKRIIISLYIQERYRNLVFISLDIPNKKKQPPPQKTKT